MSMRFGGFEGPGQERLGRLLEDPRLPQAATAFDADGTLWAGDVGELVLQRMVAERRAPADAFGRYLETMGRDAVAGCAYCVELLQGVPVAELERWSEEVVSALEHGPVLSPVAELALALAERGAEVWVVSGSNAWTVRAGVRALGLDPARVLGVTCPAPGGVLSGVPDQPVTCRHGKVEALLAATRRPLLLAAGNADYDLQLLEHAEVQLAVGPRDRETGLLRTAASRGWLTVRA